MPIIEEAIPPPSHRGAADVQSGAARAAVLGINDGLVTNISLILGVAGASADAAFIRLAGLASLMAGALSMAVGEYVSMRAQVELLERLLEEGRLALETQPERERRHLAEVLRAEGIAPATARNVSLQLAQTPSTFLAMHAKIELGINPKDLGSPWKAAASSLVTFAVGALVPLVPWFFARGLLASVLSLALAAVSALVIGGFLGFASGRNPLRAALRQLFILMLAAGATWSIGHLFKVNVT